MPEVWSWLRFVVVISLAGLLLVKKVQPLLVFSAFYLIFSFFSLEFTLPYADQLLQYNSSKVIDLLSPYSERQLYSDFRSFPGNDLGISKVGVGLKGIDYTYLPLAILPGIFSLVLGIDFRIIFVLIYFFSVLFILRFYESPKKEIVALLLFSSFIPAFIFLHYLGINSFFLLLSLSCLIQSYRLRLDSPYLGSVLIVPGICFLQSSWLFLPFFGLLFLKNGQLKVFILGCFFKCYIFRSICLAGL